MWQLLRMTTNVGYNEYADPRTTSQAHPSTLKLDEISCAGSIDLERLRRLCGTHPYMADTFDIIDGKFEPPEGLDARPFQTTSVCTSLTSDRSYSTE